MVEADAGVQAYVRFEILSYLERRPHAVDTLDGIAEWWIDAQRARIARATVLAALDQLVAQGEVEKRVLSPSTVVYAKAGEGPADRASAGELPDAQTSPQPDKE
ncbi:MAG: hypothetical protein J0H54_03810 [Rhizobiales bacterium]|nr:hypothetical protein [Hyphomicrobiales bacterium]